MENLKITSMAKEVVEKINLDVCNIMGMHDIDVLSGKLKGHGIKDRWALLSYVNIIKSDLELIENIIKNG